MQYLSVTTSATFHNHNATLFNGRPLAVQVRVQTFPLSFLEAGADIEIASKTMELAGQSGTVLLVDDDEVLRHFLQRVLIEDGFHVIEAADGAQALELASAYTEPIDLLLTDVLMPNVNGPTLASRLLQQRPDTKVLFISGYTERKLLLAQNPKFILLQKPFTAAALLAAVRQVLAPEE
jgi:two-component system cell cycle sensor histidine kinase/response regulator CckA